MKMLPEGIDQRLVDFILNGDYGFPFNAFSTPANSYRYLENVGMLTLFLAYKSGHVYHFEIMFDEESEDETIIYQKGHLFSPEESLAFTELIKEVVI